MSEAIYWVGSAVLFILGVAGFCALSAVIVILAKESYMGTKRSISHIGFHRSMKRLEKFCNEDCQ